MSTIKRSDTGMAPASNRADAGPPLTRRRGPVDDIDDQFEHHHDEEAHARLLLAYLERHRDDGGTPFAAAMQEAYMEAVNEAKWAPRPWNRVARAFDLLTTNGAKPYVYVTTRTGLRKRRRYYPVAKAGTASSVVTPRVERWTRK